MGENIAYLREHIDLLQTLEHIASKKHLLKKRRILHSLAEVFKV